MIGIICAEIAEETPIIREFEVADQQDLAGFKFISGKYANKDCVFVRCGVGKVNSAMCSQIMILKYEPQMIILSGVAGALNRWLEIGDIVVSSHLIQYDFDLTAFRRRLGEIPLVRGILENKSVPSTTDELTQEESINESRTSVQLIDADLLLLRQICNAYTKLKDSSIISGKIAAGVVATGDRFVSKNDAYYAEFLNKLKYVFGALCVEMEGASIAYVCKLNRVPFVAIRSICDHAEKDARNEFIENLTLASQRAALVLKSTISGLGDIYNA